MDDTIDPILSDPIGAITLSDLTAELCNPDALIASNASNDTVISPEMAALYSQFHAQAASVYRM